MLFDCSFSRVGPGVSVGVLIAATLAVTGFTSGPAAAQWGSAGWYGSAARPHRSPVAARVLPARQVKPAPMVVAAAPRQATPKVTPPKPTYPQMMAIISISSQKVAIYDHTGAIMHAPVSTGQPGHRTPLGIFSVIQKDRFHSSNIYSGAPMPYMQRITWSGIAMHAGALPGYPASHGCIRMPDGFASKLFQMTKLGMRVVVSPSETHAVPFSHDGLPQPVMTPATGDAPSTNTRLEGNVRLAAAGASDTPAAGVVTRFDNPQQRAINARAKARADAVTTSQKVKPLLEESHRASAEANQAAADTRQAIAALQQAETQLGQARAAEQAAATPETRAAAAQVVIDAEARGADLLRALGEARSVEAVKSQEAFAAAVASREAEEAAEAADRAAKLAEKSVEPLSIFISRKESRLFARQGFTPVFDAPVTFKDAAPLGTHLYVALDADEQAGKLKWLQVTVPQTAGAKAERAPVKRGYPAAEPVGREATAAEALERVEIPEDVKRQIAERMWVGGSLIISDYGISGETGVGTDFVVLTH